MTTNSNLDATLCGQSDLTDAQYFICGQFESMIDTCYTGWSDGKHTVVLPAHLHEILGDFGLQYFQRSLAERVGGRVTFTYAKSDTGIHTYVHMPVTMMHQLALPHAFVPQTDFSELTVNDTQVADTDVTDTSAKKIPRPMNCWIIFRDAMQGKVKNENPNCSVQQISSKCSHLWKNLSEEEKEPWLEAGKLAKEEHHRQYPDYKYTPRKPGQKKKRQSRKAKRAALNAAETSVFHLQVVSDNVMQSFDTTTTPPTATGLVAVDAGNLISHDTPVHVDNIVNHDTPIHVDSITNGGTHADTDDIVNNGTPVIIDHIFNNDAPANVSDIMSYNNPIYAGNIVNNVTRGNVRNLVNNISPIAETLLLAPQAPRYDGHIHHAETFRHARLEAEFGSGTGMEMSFDDFFGEEAYAFRDGADSDATLPSFYPDIF